LGLLSWRPPCKVVTKAADGLSSLPTASSSDCRTLLAATRMVLRCPERRTPQNIPLALMMVTRPSAVSSFAARQASDGCERPKTSPTHQKAIAKFFAFRFSAFVRCQCCCGFAISRILQLGHQSYEAHALVQASSENQPSNVVINYLCVFGWCFTSHAYSFPLLSTAIIL
jgi:hypothetical protein